jgi:hypothetical protein
MVVCADNYVFKALPSCRLGDKALGEPGHPSCLARGQYGVRLACLVIGEAGKGI